MTGKLLPVLHPYAAVVVFAVVMTVGSGVILAAITAGPPREPDAHDVRWVVAIVAALGLLSAVAAIILTVTP